jgi:hypothetical protein
MTGKDKGMTGKEIVSEDVTLYIFDRVGCRHYLLHDGLYDTSVVMTEDEVHRLIDVLLRVCGDGRD